MRFSPQQRWRRRSCREKDARRRARAHPVFRRTAAFWRAAASACVQGWRVLASIPNDGRDVVIPEPARKMAASCERLVAHLRGPDESPQPAARRRRSLVSRLEWPLRASAAGGDGIAMKRGTRVTVLRGGVVWRGRVLGRFAHDSFEASNDGPTNRILDPAKEGSDWCRGWKGRAVDALRAAAALAEPPRKNGMLAGFLATYGRLP